MRIYLYRGPIGSTIGSTIGGTWWRACTGRPLPKLSNRERAAARATSATHTHTLARFAILHLLDDLKPCCSLSRSLAL